MATAAAVSAMKVLKKNVARVTYPTGNKNFSVYQAFPAALNEIEADPFLMCDHFGPKVNDEACEDPDTFPVNWHPHRGFDICSYMLSGSGRHADSLGNRRNFAAPGVSWMSTGSGIEHAEAGGGKGEVQEGFQIWVNVPSAKKMDEPRLGDQSALLEYAHDGWRARLVAGTNGDERASSTPAYVTVQPVQIVDVMVDAGKSGAQRVFADANTAIVYVHNGAGTVCGREVAQRDVLLLDSTDRSARDVTFTAGDGGLKLLVFAGVRLNQPVAWRGPIVMTTKQELMTAYQELAEGTFFKKKADFDYYSYKECMKANGTYE